MLLVIFKQNQFSQHANIYTILFSSSPIISLYNFKCSVKVQLSNPWKVCTNCFVIISNPYNHCRYFINSHDRNAFMRYYAINNFMTRKTINWNIEMIWRIFWFSNYSFPSLFRCAFYKRAQFTFKSNMREIEWIL